MGLFPNLHSVGTVLAAIINGRTGVLPVVGAPLEPPTGAADAIRLTLMWVTPQPTHRNDPPERALNGDLTPPPASISAFFMVTTYGTTGLGEQVRALELLGESLEAFHATPVLDLPVAGFGTGRLSVVHLPTAADLMEKLFSPLQIRHRPFAIFEAAPIQLVSDEDAIPAPTVVHPGGISLSDVSVIAPPQIEFVSPEEVRGDGRVRLDAAFTGNVDRVTIGGTAFQGGALTVVQAEGVVLVDLSGNPLAAGTYDIIAVVDGVPSEAATLRISDAAVTVIDAPDPIQHSPADPLTITGANLGGGQEMFFWPHEGVSAPADVVSVAVGAAPGQVDVPAAALQGAGLDNTLYRVAVRHAPHLFTPWVLLEITP